jgi:DNA helicase II / ATP-dependent DNA helicase PcrA
MAVQHPFPRTPRPSRRPTGSPVDLSVVRPLLRGLDREQRRAVTHGEGPLLVLAGPGTGKTEVITRRIAWLIATKRAVPAEILALTFTERAADEMQARVDLLVPYGHADTAVHTFHAFGDRLLREHGHELGLPPAPRVITRPEAVMLMRERLFELGLDRYRPLSDPARNLEALVDLFCRAKEEGIDPETFGAAADELAAGAAGILALAGDDGERAVAVALGDEARGQQELGRAYTRYEAILRERGLLDFGDQVSLAVTLLRERPSIAAQVARRFRYVLVDEGQDADPMQLELMRAVAAHGNVTVVGDDDQAIYTFRGAAVESLRSLGSWYPGLRRILLRRNYRSRGPILAAAHRLITHNEPHRLASLDGSDTGLVATRRGRRPAAVELRAWPSTTDEADGVARAIAGRLESGTRPRDIAILVRTNADAEPFCRSLDACGVPWRTGGSGRLSADPAVRDLLAFLRVVVDPDAGTDLYRVATGEPYRLGGADLTTILEHARRRHRSLWQVLSELVDQPGLIRLGAPTRAAIARVVGDLEAAIIASHEQPVAAVLYAYLRSSGRYADLVAAAERGDDAPLRRVAQLFELLQAQGSLLEDARAAVVVPQLRSLLDAGADPAAEELDPETDAVAILTVHKAKGLEFPVVYLSGLVEGRFPSRTRRERLPLPAALRRVPMAEEAPWAEERRLCYVGMTRARDELILSYATERASGGRRRRPSPFIAEALDRLPPEVAARSSTAIIESATADPRSSPIAATVPGASRALSYSQVDDFLSCPLRYHLRHRLGVPTPPHHALVVGIALHQAVAAYHGAELRGRSMDLAGLQDVFTAHWRSEGFLSRAHEEARFTAGRAALARFAVDAARPPGRTTIAAERPFAVRLGGHDLRGRYDRVDEGPDGAVITDYKSGDVRDQKHATERARESLQLQLYALAWEAETGALPAAMELHFLESGLTGQVRPDPARLAKARQTLTVAATGVAAGERDPRPDRFTCGYCPFREICPSSAA